MKQFLILFFLGLAQIVYGHEYVGEEPAKDVYKRAAVIKPVKALMKAANYAKVVDEINAAFKKYDEARGDAELYDYQVSALEQIVLAENRNMYLATKPDTARYFNNLYKMYAQALACDSIEQIPDQLGSVSFKYRYGNGETLAKYRRNLKASCGYFYKKRDYVNAYKFVDLYCTTKSAPIFTGKKGEPVLTEENDSTEMAVMAVLSAYGAKNNPGVVKYLYAAMNDTVNMYKFLELGCNSYLATGDTVKAMELMEKGFMENPSQEYFFMALDKLYGERDDHAACLKYASEMVRLFPKVRNYWFVKAKHEERLGNYDAAIASYRNAIANKADDAESYSNIGDIYTVKAHELYRRNSLSVTDPGYRGFKARQRELYMEAKAAYDNARQYAPERKELWQDGLRNTYFRLNMGKELKDLENRRK